MYSFYTRHLACLEDNLKDARRKQHYARADNLRDQISETLALMRRILTPQEQQEGRQAEFLLLK